jgi:GYD domain
MIEAGAYNLKRGRYADLHDVDEFYRSGYPRYQRRPEARTEAARDLAKKLGVEVKHLYLTSGESDLVVFVETPNGDNVAKFALALGSLGSSHPYLPRLAGGGIREAGLRAALE